MKLIHVAMLLIVSSFFVTGCAVYHTYGPYKGKVVEKETNEPIEGAAVLFTFYTEGLFYVSHYADAVEKMTDKNGEFTIKKHHIFIFPRLFNAWRDYSSIDIFKPGFSSYIATTVEYDDIHPKEVLNIPLEKLNSLEERKKNLGIIYISDDVPEYKYPNLRELESRERNFIFKKSK